MQLTLVPTLSGKTEKNNAVKKPPSYSLAVGSCRGFYLIEILNRYYYSGCKKTSLVMLFSSFLTFWLIYFLLVFSNRNLHFCIECCFFISELCRVTISQNLVGDEKFRRQKMS